MAQDDMQSIPRHEAHAENMDGVTGANSNMGHCCECWKYTDEMRRLGDLAHEAVSVIVNASPSIEQTDSYRAADSYLAAYFKRHTPLAAPRF